MNEGPPGASSDPKEDFRASAASFSQLSGVLRGFCITVLVLALDSNQLGSHRQARDWISGLIIFAALSYIFSSGVLANSLNSAVIRDRMGPEALDEREVFSTQRSFFRFGIALFILGNLPLGATVVLIAYQFSLKVGLAASVVAAIGVINVLLTNLGVANRWLPLSMGIRVAWKLASVLGVGAGRGSSK